ncbi:MAG: HAMP domain-containing protein [Candidatus Latescibacteria bacterium]|nr:HAMP domain-containing protein [Candidatus Latescibacterota bacterium]
MSPERRQKPLSKRLPLVGGLFQRLFFHHLILVTVPILILGVVLVGIAQNAIRNTVNQDNLEIAARAQGQILAYIDGVVRQLELAAFELQRYELEEFDSDRFLNEARGEKALEAFRHLYAVDTTGVVVATTNFSARELPSGGLTAVNSVLSGSDLVTEPLLIESPEQTPTVIMAVPLKSFGETIGALVVEVNAEDIWTTIDDIKVGDSGSAFLVDQDGTVIAHQDKSVVIRLTDYSELESVQRALRGERGMKDLEIADPGNPEGEPMMAAFTPIESAGLRWGLIIHRPVAEVRAYTARMQLQIAVLTLVGIALALISTLVYTRRLVRPIGALLEGANRLSKGDLQYKIPVAGHDELGTLATEFNLMAEQLAQIQQRLRRVEHLDTIARFSSVVAHEIRNPLNAMQINLHLLGERVGTEEQEYLDVISGEIHRLENLVREFQTISRPPALSPQKTNMNDLLEDIVSLQRGTAAAQGVKLEVDFDPDLPVISVDRNRITQAALNVILNALQAMPKGGRLSISTRREEELLGEVTITVSDTGEGIPEEDLPHVFDFYYTSRDSGSGLGLSIAHRIIYEHGGQVNIISSIEKGTTILITLPSEPPVDINSPVQGI